MTDDAMSDDALLEEFLDVLGDVRIKFWTCPVDGHSDRPGERGQPVVTVEWRGDVAHCTFPGCGRTSKPTKPEETPMADGNDMYERAYHDIHEVLDVALGPDEENGADPEEAKPIADRIAALAKGGTR